MLSQYKYQLLSLLPVLLVLVVHMLNPVNYYWDDLMLMDAARSVASGSLWVSFDPSLQMSSDLSELEPRLMIHWAPLKAIILGLFLAVGFSEVAASLLLWTLLFTSICFIWSKLVASFHVSGWDSTVLIIGFPLLLAPALHPYSTEILAMAIFMWWLWLAYNMVRGYPPEIRSVILLSVVAGLAFWARYSVIFLLPVTLLLIFYVTWDQKFVWKERIPLLVSAVLPGLLFVITLFAINKSAAGTSSFIEEFGFSNLHWANLKTLDPFALVWINATGSGQIRDFLSAGLGGRIFGFQIYSIWQYLSLLFLLVILIIGFIQERSRNITILFIVIFAGLYGVLAISSLTTEPLGHFTFLTPHRFYLYAYPVFWLIILSLLRFSKFLSVQSVVVFSVLCLFIAAPVRYMEHLDSVNKQAQTYLQHEDKARSNMFQIQRNLEESPAAGKTIILAADMMQAPHLLKHGDFPVLISLPEGPFASSPVTIFLVGSPNVSYAPGSYYYIFPVIRENGIRDVERFELVEDVTGDLRRFEVR